MKDCILVPEAIAKWDVSERYAQKMMAALYDVEVYTTNEHIKKLFTGSELTEAAAIRYFRIVRTEGSRQVGRDIKHYKPTNDYCLSPERKELMRDRQIGKTLLMSLD